MPPRPALARRAVAARYDRRSAGRPAVSRGPNSERRPLARAPRSLLTLVSVPDVFLRAPVPTPIVTVAMAVALALALAAAGDAPAGKVPEIIGAFEKAKKASSKAEIVGLINDFDLPREAKQSLPYGRFGL